MKLTECELNFVGPNREFRGPFPLEPVPMEYTDLDEASEKVNWGISLICAAAYEWILS